MCIHYAHTWLHRADVAEDCLHPSTLRTIPPYGWGLIVSQVWHPAASQYGRLVSQRRVRSHLDTRDDLRQAQSRLLGRVAVGTGLLDHEVTSCNNHRKCRVGCKVEEEQASDMSALAAEVVLKRGMSRFISFYFTFVV